MKLKRMICLLLAGTVFLTAAGCRKSPSSGDSDIVSTDFYGYTQSGNSAGEFAEGTNMGENDNSTQVITENSYISGTGSYGYTQNDNGSDKNSQKAHDDGLDYSVKDGKLSEEVLQNYLNKAMTFNGLISMSQYGTAPDGFNPTFERDMEFIRKVGPKYIGRAAYFWSYPKDMNIDYYKEYITEGAREVHEFDPDIILEAAIFETCYKRFTDTVKIPEYVFKAFGLKPENRTFRYEDMWNTDFADNHWGEEHYSVPDITKTETKMWFYYWGTFYIDAGYECIHMGQSMLIGSKDIHYDMRRNMKNFREVFDMLREYAKEHGRRNFVMISSHAYDPDYVTYSDKEFPSDYTERKLIYDFHTFPIRPDDTGQVMGDDGSMPVKITEGYLDSIYGRSAGGLNPNGWMTEENPYIVEFDNCNVWTDTVYPTGTITPWGKDESTWFMLQPMGTHGKVLEQLHKEITEISGGNGHLLLPCHQPLARQFMGVAMIKPYTESGVYYLGLDFEDTVKSIYNSYNKK